MNNIINIIFITFYTKKLQNLKYFRFLDLIFFKKNHPK